MDNPEKFESFEQVLFFMLKNAIKQASYELMMETEPQELSEDELEELEGSPFKDSIQNAKVILCQYFNRIRTKIPKFG